MSFEQIGLVQSIGPVWVLTFLWAPTMDRFGRRRHGHYRPGLPVLRPLLTLSALPLDVAAQVRTWSGTPRVPGLQGWIRRTVGLAAATAILTIAFLPRVGRLEPV